MLHEIDVLPVVHAGTFEVLVVDFESQRMDQMQTCTDREACPSDVARVVGNERRAENDVQGRVRDDMLQRRSSSALNVTEDSENGSSSHLSVNEESIKGSLTARLKESLRRSILARVGKAFQTMTTLTLSRHLRNRFSASTWMALWCLALLPGALHGEDHLIDEPARHDDCAVIISSRSADADGWKQVASAARAFHQDAGVTRYVFEDTPLELKDALGKQHPRHLILVAAPEELNRTLFLDLHRLCRGLDDDPWPDFEWGILTGRTWESAMRQIVTRTPLVIRKAAGVASLDVTPFDEALCWDESFPGRSVLKRPDGSVVTRSGIASQTLPGIIASLNQFGPDFFFSSGRATQHDWRVGYDFKAGAFKVEDGRLVGVTLDRERLPVASNNPKVWLAAGNCLLGDVDGIDSMALAILDSASATQFVGYSGRTWHGRAGWGTAEWFLSDPGRWTLSESVFFNQIQLIHELREIDPALATLDLGNYAPREDPLFGEKLAEVWGQGVEEAVFQQALGHLWDRDVLVFYGDPSWDARLESKRPLWESSFELDESAGVCRVTVTGTNDGTFSSPPSVALPIRLAIGRTVSAPSGTIIADDFVMFSEVTALGPGEQVSAVFEAVAVARDQGVRRVRDWPQCESQIARLPLAYQALVRTRLEEAGAHRGEFVAAIESLEGVEALEAIAFLIAFMPERDLGTISAELMAGHVTEAVRIRRTSPFCRDLPDEIFLNEILPHVFVGERREFWRPELRERFAEIAWEAPTQAEAVRRLDRELWTRMGVVYHPDKRPKTDQSPSETIDCGVASCTGLSILLASTCRSVGIPARLAGVPMWHDDAGNHTWVEVWDDGRWEFVEALGGEGYGKAWWLEKIALANPKDPLYTVWATSYRPTGAHFPLEWDPTDLTIPAVDVSARYLALPSLNETDAPR